MHKVLIGFIALILVIQLFAQGKITVAVAANMQYTIEALKEEFNKTDKTKIDIVLGSSGNLTHQIMQGAPFDIFVSADTSFPQRLADNSFTAAPPEVYAQGLLVLWSTNLNIELNANLKFLLKNSIRHIAIANTRTAPYGAAAEYLLKKYGLYDNVKDKLVTGESITQATQYIITKAVDVGFTAKSIVISNEMRGKGKWVELNRNDYPPIKQAAALLKFSEHNNTTAAKKFYQFLFSEKAKEIYKKFGYIIPHHD